MKIILNEINEKRKEWNEEKKEIKKNEMMKWNKNEKKENEWYWKNWIVNKLKIYN